MAWQREHSRWAICGIAHRITNAAQLLFSKDTMTLVRSGSGRVLLAAAMVGLLVYAAGVGLAGFAMAGVAMRVAGLLVLLWVTVIYLPLLFALMMGNAVR